MPTPVLASAVRRHRWKWPRVLVETVALVWAAYLLAANGLLASHLIPRVIRSLQNNVDMNYRAAWSRWPGDLQVSHYWIDVSDLDVVQLRFEVDRVDARVALLDLFKARFHATRVEAKGVTFRLRPLVSPKEATPERLARMPPILGYPSPERLPQPNVPTNPEGLWSVELDRVHLTPVREIWVDDYHFMGGADVRSSFALQPLREVWVGPSELVGRGGRLLLDGKPALSSVSADLHFVLRPFDVEHSESIEVLHAIDVSARLTSGLIGLSGLDTMIGRGVRISGAPGTARLQVEIHRGRLMSQTSGELREPWMEVRAKGVSVAGVAQVDLAPASAGSRAMHLSARFADGRVGLGAVRVNVHRAFISGTTRDLDLVHALRDVRVEADVDQGHIDQVGTLLQAMGSDLRLEGRVTTRGHLWVDLHTMSAGGELALAAPDLWLTRASGRAAGAAKVSASFQSSDLRKGGEASGALELSGQAPAWQLRAQVSDSQFDVLSKTLRGAVSGQVWGLDSLLQTAGVARVASWASGTATRNRVQVRSSFAWGEDGLRIPELVADSTAGSATGWLRLSSDHRSGAVLIRYGPLKAGLGIADHSVEVHPLGATSWYLHQTNVAQLSSRLGSSGRSRPRGKVRR